MKPNCRQQSHATWDYGLWNVNLPSLPLSWTTRSLSTVALCIFALFCPLLSHFLCSITHYSSQQQCQAEYIPMTLQLWCYWTENWEEICKIFSGQSRISLKVFIFLTLDMQWILRSPFTSNLELRELLKLEISIW